MDSILDSIKKMLGIEPDYEHFDSQITMNINTVFLTLNQLGVGPTTGFYIEDKSSKWEDFIVDPILQHAIKSYVYLRVKMIFDPAETSYVLTSMKNQIAELEWRFREQETIDEPEEV